MSPDVTKSNSDVDKKSNNDDNSETAGFAAIEDVPLIIDLQYSRQSRLQECMQCIFALLVYKCIVRICVDMKLVIYALVMFAAYV